MNAEEPLEAPSQVCAQRMQEETPCVCNQGGRSSSQKSSFSNHLESHVKIQPSPAMVGEPSAGAAAPAHRELGADIHSVTSVSLHFSFTTGFMNFKECNLTASVSKENCVCLDRKVPRPEAGSASSPTVAFCSHRIFPRRTEKVEDHCRHGNSHF